MHAGTTASSEDKDKDKNHHQEVGKKSKHGKRKGKGKQDKTKEQFKATTSNSNGVRGIGAGIKATPSIFYVPHQDDDALAMAPESREHIEAGRRVIVHLYSDWINALLCDIVSGAAPCILQHPPHKLDLTLKDVVTGRTREFRQSFRALGVKDEDIFETGWSDMEPLKDYEVFQDKLKELILGYERKYPRASHNRFYRTYTHYNPPHHRSAQFVRALPQFLPYKQSALDQYKRWDPSKGDLAWGYHSVKALIDAAYYDPHVYLDMLDNDPTNPENIRRVKTKVKGGAKMEIESLGEGEEDERKQGMFPAIWKSNREKNTNKMLLEEQGKEQEQEQEAQDLDDGLMGLHRKIPAGTHPAYSNSDNQKSEEEEEEEEEEETRWDEKEADMRLQVLKAFGNPAQRPEGKEYRESSSTLATNTGV
ncbi:hypothetical protein BGW39_003535 [Mortierella sp. 14UC]|nr:hypothetical protein BGW39_003535 [Mortierella sp. 14UC]